MRRRWGWAEGTEKSKPGERGSGEAAAAEADTDTARESEEAAGMVAYRAKGSEVVAAVAAESVDIAAESEADRQPAMQCAGGREIARCSSILLWRERAAQEVVGVEEILQGKMCLGGRWRRQKQ